MKTIVKILAVAAIATTVYSCSDPDEITIGQVCLSPDQTKVATFYTVASGGGAGSQYEYVSVQNRDVPLDKDNYVLMLKSGYSIRMEWSNESKLKIQYPSFARADVQKSDHDGISIEYQTRVSADGLFPEGSGCKLL